MRKLILLVCLMLLLPAGTTLAYRDADADPEPREIARVLEAGDQVLDTEAWRVVSAEDSEEWSSVGWYNDEFDGVAHIVFFNTTNAGELSTLETYLEPQDFDNLFGNYEGYQPGQRCELDGTILQQFTTTLNGVSYNTRYWVMPISDDQIMALHLIFPVGQEAILDFYANRFMTDKASCEVDAP